jgi:DNA polymerase-3 subunit delta'
MQEIIDQYKTNGQIHHFHILIGDRFACQSQIENFCDNDFGCATVGNQLFIKRNFDRLLIDDAKEISKRSFMKTGEGNKMVFCVSFNDITREAQNALLKIIEEPSKETYFFLIAPRKDVFLPTVMSRAMVSEISGTAPKSDSGDGSGRGEGNENFADEVALEILSDKKTLGEKMKTVESLVKKIKDKKVEKGVAREIVKKIIIELEKDVVKNAGALKSLQKIDDYLGDTSASVKLLLEKVVLSL